MKQRLSVVIAAANDAEIIKDALKSIVWADEIIVVLANLSHDKTKEISQGFTSKIYVTSNHLGKQRNLGIIKATGDWILILDTDERVSPHLKNEIVTILSKTQKYTAYKIPFKNYFLGHQLNWGNQRYQKIRLFKKNCAKIENLATHPEIVASGLVGELSSYIAHYSFRCLTQTIQKFTYYAHADVERLAKVETASWAKLITYPLHMFYTLAITNEAWRDGVWGIMLAVCFAYYECARHFFLLKQSRIKEVRRV